MPLIGLDLHELVVDDPDRPMQHLQLLVQVFRRADHADPAHLELLPQHLAKEIDLVLCCRNHEVVSVAEALQELRTEQRWVAGTKPVAVATKVLSPQFLPRVRCILRSVHCLVELAYVAWAVKLRRWLHVYVALAHSVEVCPRHVVDRQHKLPPAPVDALSHYMTH